jgi:hypothetical protein
LVSIARNGTVQIALSQEPASSYGPYQTVATVARLSAGDFVTLRVSQTSGGSRTIGGGGQEFSPELAIAWIGP